MDRRPLLSQGANRPGDRAKGRRIIARLTEPTLSPSWHRLAGGSFPLLVLLFAALYLAYGTESPFLPSFLQKRSLSPPQIGIVLAAGTAVRLSLGPLIGVLADRFGLRLVLAAAAGASGLIGLCYLAGHTLAVLLAVSMAHALATAPLSPLSDALTLAAGKRERSFDYGWVRGAGSAAFVLGTLASGFLVARFGLASIIVASSALFTLMLVPLPFLQGATPQHAPELGRTVRVLAANRSFRTVVLAAALVIGSHAMSDAFAVIYWRAKGLTAPLISTLLAEAVLSEIVVFVLIGPLLLRRVGPRACAALSACAGIVRWTVLATTTEPAALAVTEAMHGLTFSLIHLTCMRVIGRTVPGDLAGTAQTIYGTLCLGLASALVTVLSGWLYGALGATAFALMAVQCAAALPVCARLERTSDAAV